MFCAKKTMKNKTKLPLPRVTTTASSNGNMEIDAKNKYILIFSGYPAKVYNNSPLFFFNWHWKDWERRQKKTQFIKR